MGANLGGLVRNLVRLSVVLCALPGAAATYYVSSVSGSDGNNGTSPSTPFASVTKVNTIQLQPGDEVRFFCGETWRAQPLIITRSGAAGQPIVYGSYPAGCSDKPLLSGAQPVSYFGQYAAPIYVAYLDAGTNANRFPLGVNQVFRGSERLPMGRWPNGDVAGGGYATVDSETGPRQIVDAALPAVNWAGAVMHIKGIRWYMLNREVVSSTGSTLDVAEDLACWSGCAGWGYFLNNHLATLDREGEWFFDAATNRLYVYTTAGNPPDGEIEASPILAGNGTNLGGVILGNNLQQEISWVTVENLRIERWFDSGITTPINLEADENHDLIIRDNEIRDVDGTGIRLATWVWNAAANGNGPDGWRGGRNQVVTRNVVERANQFGITAYSNSTQYTDNVIRDVARIDNLGREGMGCGYSGTNCTENGDGIRMNLDPGSAAYTGGGNQLLRNRLERIGMNGMDVFGPNNVVSNNVIDQACISKGDCGAIRLFGRSSLAATNVHDVTISGNIIRDTIGNTDGCAPAFAEQFGLGIYIDNYSRDVQVTGNTIIGSTWVGLLYQRSTGQASNNVLYGNVRTDWGSQLDLAGNETVVASSGNVMFSLGARRRTLHIPDRLNLLASDGNYYFNPYEDASIADDETGSGPMTLVAWQAFSGRDGSSRAHWYNQAAGEVARSRIFVNDSGSAATVALMGGYRDLDQNVVTGSINLPAWSSRVLVADPAGAGQKLDVLVGEGAGPGNPNDVRVYTGAGSATAVSFLAYQAGSFGTNVAGGRIQAGSYGEILTGPGPGAVFGPHVRAFDRAGTSVTRVNFFAYGTLRYGVAAAAAELEGDGFDEILSGAGPGAVFGPHVRAFNYDGASLGALAKINFFAYGTLKWGVNVTAGDVDADGYHELLTGPGPGAVFRPQVRGFDYDGASVAPLAKINFFPYLLYYGVNLAGGDVDGDGFDEIATAPGAGPINNQQVRGFDYDGATVAGIPSYDVTPPGGFQYGGRVALGDVGGDGGAELVTAPSAPAAPATVRLYSFDVVQNQGAVFTPFTSSFGAKVGTGALGW